MNFKYIFLNGLMAISLIGIVHGDEKPVGFLRQMKRSTFDFCGLEDLGSESLSAENEQFVRSIQQEMGMKNFTIRLRRMSNKGKNYLSMIDEDWLINERIIDDYDYISSLPEEEVFKAEARINHFGFKDFIIFINEEWFNTLSIQEKSFVVGHELQHIKKNHKASKIVSFMAFYFLTNILLHKKESSDLDNVSRVNSLFAPLSISWLLTSYFSRMYEHDADLSAVKELNCLDGGLSLLQKQRKQIEDPESRFAIKRGFYSVVTWIIKTVRSFVASQPSLDERLAYMRELKEQQELEQIA